MFDLKQGKAQVAMSATHFPSDNLVSPRMLLPFPPIPLSLVQSCLQAKFVRSPAVFRIVPHRPPSKLRRESMRKLLSVITLLCVVVIGTGSVSIAAEESGSSMGAPDAARPEKDPEPTQRPLRRLEGRLLGATPDEKARLEEERKRLLAAAAAFGTDPTAIIGYYQLGYGHNVFTNNLRVDQTTATIRLPITPNWLLQVNIPYTWADLNQPRGFTANGIGDMTMRTGGRIYSSEYMALFLGTDAAFPTASERQLGTKKYTIGPGGAMAVPLARLQSLLLVLAQNFHSIGGDPSRSALHFMQIQSAINTIWSEQWWSLVAMTWDVDWNHGRRTTMNLLGEVGYRFDNHWNLFVGPGVGVIGRDSPLGLDWTVQAGVRWVFQTPLFPERILESFSSK